MVPEPTRRLRRPAVKLLGVAALVCAAAGLSGCVTVAEFRKLERKVYELQGGEVGEQSREQIANLTAELDALSREVDGLRGELEVARHESARALDEARAARAANSRPGPPPGSPGGENVEATPGADPTLDPAADPPGGVADGEASTGSADPESPSAAVEGTPGAAPPGTGSSAAEVQAYRAGLDAWRKGEAQSCIERFREFLQTYRSSPYADDAAYWMADCYFKQGDYKTAILRFDDVVNRYPDGNKAADALYRQGEALLELGPNYGKAASRAFERVLAEYPDSSRVDEARRQLELLGAG